MNLPTGETIFITFRLAGSIRQAVARRLQAEWRAALEAIRLDPSPAARHPAAHQRAQKRFFARFDAELDRAEVGPTYLENEKLAEIVAGELLLLEETGFRVVAFAQLPNHVHALLHLPAGARVSFYKGVELLLQRTAAQCRRVLRTRLPPEADFWQAGSHNYVVTEADEVTRITRYLTEQARNLRLPERWWDWPYVYTSTSLGNNN